jgi:hypothetical protein
VTLGKDIEAEVREACVRLGADPELAIVISRATLGDMYHAYGKLGAGADPLSILGSYGTHIPMRTC